MKLRHFVTICSVILMAWLSLTFFYEVPYEHYLEQDNAQILSPVDELEQAELGVEVIAGNDEFSVSVSP